MSDLIYKTFNFKTSETKETDVNGVKVGVVKGYASTFNNVDRDGDIIMPGAFSKTISELASNDRPIRMLYQHSTQELIGGFPIDRVSVDQKGLFVEGHINLDVQRGREAFSLAKQNVLTDFSIGFSIVEADFASNGVRQIKELRLWEVSMVGEPANPQAQILDVKNTRAVVPFQGFELAMKTRQWDRNSAVRRIREKTDSIDSPSDDYFKYFLFYDKENKQNFDAYKLPIADVIGGEIKAVPRAVFSAASVINGARGGIDIPESDIDSIKRNIVQYYDEMGLPSPFNEEAFFINQQVLKNIDSVNALEKIFSSSGAFSRKAACTLASIAFRELNSEDKKKDNFNEPNNSSQSEFAGSQMDELKNVISKLKHLTIGETKNDRTSNDARASN